MITQRRLMLMLSGSLLGVILILPLYIWYIHNPQYHQFIKLLGLFLSGLLGFLAWHYITERRPQITKSQGSARWAKNSELAQFTYTTNMRAILRSRKPHKEQGSIFIIGKTYQGITIRLTQRQQESHILLTASTGGGKTSALIVPNILRERGHRSFFATNPKGDIFDITSGAASRFHEIWHLCPDTPTLSNHYDPLSHIYSMEDAQTFAEIWISNTGRSSNEPYWDREAEQLLVMLAMHLREAEPDAHFPRLLDLLYEPYGTLKAAMLNSESTTARKLAQRAFSVWDADPKIRATVMGDVATRFRSFMTPSLQEITSGNTIDFVAMAKHPVGLYLTVFPSEAERLRPLVACFISQMFREWSRYAASQPDHEIPHGIMCYLDEFANAGKIPSMSQYISMMRSQRVGLLMAIQSIHQLEELYGEHQAKTILNNAKTHIVFSGVGQEDADYYSRRIGTTTVLSTTRNDINKATFGTSESGRPLITPDEIRTMPRGEVIVIPEREPAIRVRTHPFQQDQALLALTKMPPVQVRRLSAE